MGIELRGVVKQVGADTHIFETDLILEKGGFNVLLGTTQSGKTTLMRLMAGLERPTNGEVWFDGENVTGVPVQKRSVAMVYQAFVNYPNMSVFDNIASPLRVARRPKAEIKERVRREMRRHGAARTPVKTSRNDHKDKAKRKLAANTRNEASGYSGW